MGISQFVPEKNSFKPIGLFRNFKTCERYVDLSSKSWNRPTSLTAVAQTTHKTSPMFLNFLNIGFIYMCCGENKKNRSKQIFFILFFGNNLPAEHVPKWFIGLSTRVGTLSKTRYISRFFSTVIKIKPFWSFVRFHNGQPAPKTYGNVSTSFSI